MAEAGTDARTRLKLATAAQVLRRRRLRDPGILRPWQALALLAVVVVLGALSWCALPVGWP